MPVKTLARLLFALTVSSTASVVFAMTAQDPTILRGPIQDDANAPIIERVWFAHTGKNGFTRTTDAEGNIVEEGVQYGVDIWIDARLPNGDVPQMDEIVVKRNFAHLPQDPSSKHFVSRVSIADFQFPYTETDSFTATYNGFETVVSYTVTIQAPGGVAAGSASSSTTPLSFYDVPEDHENADAVSYVKSEGIVRGYTDGSYRPDQTVNRAEFTKIIIAAIASEEEIENCDLSIIEYLSDVDLHAWYAPYICVGRARGILTGHLPSSAPPYFAPLESINAIEASKILAVGFDIGEPPLDCLVNYGADCVEAAERGELWYERHVEALIELNAVPVSVEHFMWHHMTRGEMAEMTYRLKAGITNKPSRTSYEELED